MMGEVGWAAELARAGRDRLLPWGKLFVRTYRSRRGSWHRICLIKRGVMARSQRAQGGSRCTGHGSTVRTKAVSSDKVPMAEQRKEKVKFRTT